MLDFFLIIISSVAAIASPASPNQPNYVYTAKASSLNEAVLIVEKVPETTETELALKIAYTEKEGEKVEEENPLILEKIAFCESGGKQFDKNGQVIRGKENPNDIGKWQINILLHYETARKLGYDIFTEKGNKDYALWLYKKNGTKDWEASKDCWLAIKR